MRGGDGLWRMEVNRIDDEWRDFGETIGHLNRITSSEPGEKPCIVHVTSIVT